MKEKNNQPENFSEILLPPAKSANKTVVLLLSFLISIVLILLGTVLYLNFKPRPTPPGPTPTTVPTPPTPISQPGLPFIEPKVGWLNYQNQQYPFLKFKYPEGAQINFKNENKELCGLSGCFALDMIYEEMKLRVDRIVGIGGGAMNVFSAPYYIVAGNQYEGIGKAREENAKTGQVILRYFRYKYGGLQFGSFLTDTATFTFTILQKGKTKYEPIADVVACSVLDCQPNNRQVLGKTYLDVKKATLMAVDEWGNQSIIFAADQGKAEYIENSIMNPTYEYIAIVTFLGKGPDSFLQIYNIDTKSLVTINGLTRFPVIGGRRVWINNYQFIDSESNGFNKYDVKNLTKTSITQEEYYMWLKQFAF